MVIEIPDDIAAELGENPAERSQKAKEAIALELYREGRISLRTMGRLVGFGDDVWAADAFRADHALAISGVEADDIEHFLP